MTFTPNQRGIAALASTPQMTRYLGTLADAGARAIASAAPGVVRHSGARIHGEASRGEGRIVIDSPFWHLPEYGASRYPMAPFIRPTATQFFAGIGARFIAR